MPQLSKREKIEFNPLQKRLRRNCKVVPLQLADTPLLDVKSPGVDLATDIHPPAIRAVNL